MDSWRSSCSRTSPASAPVEVGDVRTQRGDGVAVEGVADHAGPVQDPPLVGRQRVEPGRDQGLERGGRTDRVEVEPVGVGEDVLPAARHHEVAVDQGAHRLDREQRDALGALDERVARGVGEPHDQPVEEVAHVACGQGLQVQHGGPTVGGQRRVLLEQARPAEQQHEAGEGADRQEVLEEVQQPVVGVLARRRSPGRPGARPR